MKIRFKLGEYSVAIFAHCGNFVSVLNDKGEEVARIMERHLVEKGTAVVVAESREDLMSRAQAVRDALNVVYQEANL